MSSNENAVERAQMHAIEAILFAAGESVSTDAMSRATGLTPGVCKKLALELAKSYDEEERGMQILQLEDRFQMTTRPTYYETVRVLYRSLQKTKLTEAQLEVLAIVTYKQPVTKLEIDDVRGVHSDAILDKLIEYGLVEEVGRLKAPGRPILFGTSEEFLRSFGFASIKDIPGLPEESAARMEQLTLAEALELEAAETENEEGIIET